MFNDTIVAIATSTPGAVSIIRISGNDTFDVLSKIFDKDLSLAKEYTIHYGTIFDEEGPVDEVLVSVFRAPRSYTGEDVVEINCHGGTYVTRKILNLCLGNGARLARRGEFTERAFLNGKMDLSEAESVNDLINATDKINAHSAIHSLRGSVQKIIDPLVEDITQIISNIEVNIDYPEYDDVHVLTEEEILPKAKKWIKDIDVIIKKAEEATFIRSGIDTVIVGKPNVGKSSLLNALLEEDKAIVTNIAGTTRDLVEGSVKVGNVTLNLIDTAGIHESEDTIEKIGIEKSREALEKAELVLLVLDSTQDLSKEDKELLELTKDRDRIIIYNKNDEKQIDDVVSISAKNREIDALIQTIEKKYEKEIHSAESDTLNNERQIGLARSARRAMQHAIDALEMGCELDLVTIDLQEAYYALKEITGKTCREDLLDEIFSRFCLGK
ncbi:MAG: tRNA uridine-5-carboxymethylaminomethyl(34) synthesis GTPase MnmE [Bulleidia sp.]|nr:tRNA uridine-5-carboxymethylaminomethyl(34) synthesis GTPase MnmE [Bulleidia sp.]